MTVRRLLPELSGRVRSIRRRVGSQGAPKEIKTPIWGLHPWDAGLGTSTQSSQGSYEHPTSPLSAPQKL